MLPTLNILIATNLTPARQWLLKEPAPAATLETIVGGLNAIHHAADRGLTMTDAVHGFIVSKRANL